MLGTHSVQIESGFLEFNDQYTLYAWHEWFVEHMKNTWLALTQINLSYECFLFFKKIQIRFCGKKKQRKRFDLLKRN